MAYKPAIASMALGRAWVHDLPAKFTAAAAAGLPGIEIFHEDLTYLAASYPGGAALPSNHILAATSMRHLADTLDLEIMAIGPFIHCEGLLDPAARTEKLEELHLWFRIASILGTDLIQIPCTFLSTAEVTGDLETIVADLRHIADLGAREDPPVRFAYENLCFGTFSDTWERAWRVVKMVDRANFGLCLDTFNIAGREWADPAAENGRVGRDEAYVDEVFRASLERLVREVDVEKVFYVQVVDAERLRQPLREGHAFYVEGQKARMSWSRNSRLFMFEEERGGYLPVLDVLRAICDEETGLGYKGWISAELFNRSLVDEREEVPREHAERCMRSWKKIVEAMGWEDIVEPTRVEGKSGAKTSFAPPTPPEDDGIWARL